MATTTQDHMAARNDGDLRERLIAKAEMLGIDDPGQRIYQVMGRLVASPLTVTNGEGGTTTTSITEVYAFAAQRVRDHAAATPPRPGEDLAAVLDTYLEAALRAVLGDDIPEGD